MCLQTRHLLRLQTRHLLCQQTRHLLCHCVSRHLPRHPLQHSPHRGGRFAAAPVGGMLGGMSWEMSADTMTQQMSCLLTQQMSCLQTQQMSCLQTHFLRLWRHSARKNRFPRPKHTFPQKGVFVSKNKTAGGNGTATPLGLGSKTTLPHPKTHLYSHRAACFKK